MLKQPNLRIEAFDYPLPEARIATQPLTERDASQLLIYQNGQITDSQFRRLPHHLPPGALMVLNDTRVIAARVFFRKQSGGIIEVFCLSPQGADLSTALAAQGETDWECMVGGASKWKPGQILKRSILIEGAETALEAQVVARTPGHFVIRFRFDPGYTFSQILEAAGQIPLPPYMHREAVESDKTRYQTVFAREEGSVAAPTASLHFTPRLMEDIQTRGVDTAFLTLHVGAGTFKPVKSEEVAEHVMHHEPFFITVELLDALLAHEQIIAVGTTSARALESLYWLCMRHMKQAAASNWHLDQWEAYNLPDQVPASEAFSWLKDHMLREGMDTLSCTTSLLIMPPYRFRVVDILVTNFHQPRSTLLLLIAAFIGDDWQRVYEHALAGSYRFLSYGDSCLLFRVSHRDTEAQLH